MGRIKVIPFKPGAAGKSGISISLTENKGGQFFTVTITESAQTEFFGGPLDPAKDAIDVQLFDDPKSCHLMGLARADVGDADAVTFSPSIRGSIRARLVPWAPVANGKRPAVQCPAVNRDTGKFVSVKLPEWARPAVRKIAQGEPLFKS